MPGAGGVRKPREVSAMPLLIDPEDLSDILHAVAV